MHLQPKAQIVCKITYIRKDSDYPIEITPFNKKYINPNGNYAFKIKELKLHYEGKLIKTEKLII